MKATVCAILTATILTGCVRKGDEPVVKASAPARGTATPDNVSSLADARKGFQTKLVRQESAKEPVSVPPAKVFRVVHYEAPKGKMAAYLSPEKTDGKKHPAIIWITGGDSNSIDDACWKPAPVNNDQTARAFPESGIILMFPSLRGGNDNPGFKEGFFGEVEDILAAADFLAKQPDVDPERIYLGGHSTGGTLVMLVAACPNPFRAIFSFGPVHNVAGYPPEFLPFDLKNNRELELRAPILWLSSIKTPTFVFEGTVEGNIEAVELMATTSKNQLIHFYPVQGANHFSILSPTTHLIASRILTDKGPTTNILFGAAQLDRPFKQR